MVRSKEHLAERGCQNDDLYDVGSSEVGEEKRTEIIPTSFTSGKGNDI
jgi:hypothetical protein